MLRHSCQCVKQITRAMQAMHESISRIHNKVSLPQHGEVCNRPVVDTAFVDIYVDTENIPTCRYKFQDSDTRTMENTDGNEHLRS